MSLLNSPSCVPYVLTIHTRQIRGAIAVLSVIVGLLVLHSPAQAGITISVTPSFLEFAVDPGANFDEVITVSNEGSDSTGIIVEVSATIEGRPDISSTDWIQVEPDQFTLGPFKARGDPGPENIQKVKISVNVPNDAQPGGRYATIFFRTVPVSFSSGREIGFFGGSAFGAEIGVRTLLTVRGEGLNLEAQLSRLVPVALGPGRIGFRAEVTNRGNVHIAITGHAELYDQAGNPIGDFKLLETTAILPGETKSFNLRGFQEVPPGIYRASATIDYGWTPSQIEAASEDPDNWGQREAVSEIRFDSAPKLLISDFQVDASTGEAVNFTVDLVNFGDVEVSPTGVIDMRDADGEQVVYLTIGAGSVTVEPGTSAISKLEYTGALSSGDYTARSVFNYHGEENAERTATIHIGQDIIPPIAPEAPAVRKADIESLGGGTPIWVWALVWGFGGALVVALLLLVAAAIWRLLGLNKM